MNTTSARKDILRAGAGLALVGALALSACAPDDDPAAFDETEPASAEETTDETTEEAEPADEETEEDAESELESEDDDTDAEAEAGTQEEMNEGFGAAEDATLRPDDALQTSTYSISHEDVEGEITAGVHSVTVEGDTMLLQMSFTADYDEPEDGPLQFNALHARGQNLGNAQWLRPILADRENLKSYHVLRWGRDGSHNNYWMTMVGYSGDGLYAPAGETIPFFAYFAAPEDDIDQMDISIPELSISFEGIELTADASENGEPEDSDDGDDDQ